MESLFNRRIEAGADIRPILVAGVLERTYEGERSDAAMAEALETAIHRAADEVRGKTYAELDTVELLQMKGKLSVCSVPSPVYAAGHYFLMEQIALMPVYTELYSAQEQEVTVNLRGGQGGRMLALLNGETVFDNTDYSYRKRERVYVFEHKRTPEEIHGENAVLPLKTGKNTLMVLAGKINRGTGISFSMQLLEAEHEVRASVPLSIPEKAREEALRSELETHMEDDVYLLGETPVLHVGRVPMADCLVHAVVEKKDGARIDIAVDESDRLLSEASDPGMYTVSLTWSLKDGTVLSEKALSYQIYRTIAKAPGYERFDERRRLLLELLASQKDALSLYRLGRASEITPDLVRNDCDRVLRRADCADFLLMPLLWLVWEDRNAGLLSAEVLDMIRGAALDFRYWVDEPGSSSMFYCSENHRVGFHVCEYLAGMLYPTDLFTNSAQNGMFHALKGRMHLVEWLNQRCRFGFDEPHSDTYLPITMSALLVLREVLPREEYNMRNMVNELLDLMVFIFAVSDLDGTFATPRGRGYNIPLRASIACKSTCAFWLFFGNCEMDAVPKGEFAPAIAFSYYVPPKHLVALAEDFTPATLYYKQGIMHFDKHNADFTIRRCPEYMLGGVRDHNVGMCDMHFISAMAALRGDITVFFSAPNNCAEGSGLRPDYWAGQAFLPRVLMTGRTLSVIWHDVQDPTIWMTHCHFNRRKFDEVAARDGWTFGRKGDGYIGIWSSVPHSFREEGLYAGRELIADGRETVWITECGSAREDGSFENFMNKLAAASPVLENEEVTFRSPGSGLIVFGLSEGFTVDGNEVEIPQMTVRSPWLNSRFGSGRFDYDCEGYRESRWTYPACE